MSNWMKQEVTVRKKIMDEFKKDPKDFDTLKEYNDHLEMLEDWSKYDSH